MHERRQQPRAMSVFKSAYVQTQGGLQFVTLRNISGSGVCMDACPGMAEGAEVEFCIDSTGMRKGTVRWVKDGLCGIAITDDQCDETSAQPFPPRSVRLPLSVDVGLYIGGQREEGVLHNISIRGACISSAAAILAGQLVSIEVCGWYFELASVRWVKRGLFGLRFAEPIHPGVFRQLVAAIQQLPGSGPTATIPASTSRPAEPTEPMQRAPFHPH